jgi:hypothetical protein
LSRLSDMLCEYDPQFQEPLARVREAASLVLMVLAAWEVVRRLAVRLVEESLYTRACPAAGGLARLRAVWAVATEQRLPPANAAHVVWGDRLAAAGRTVSEGLQGLAGCAVGSGVGIGGAPAHGGGSAVDGLSGGDICAL